MHLNVQSLDVSTHGIIKLKVEFLIKKQANPWPKMRVLAYTQKKICQKYNLSVFDRR